MGLKIISLKAHCHDSDCSCKSVKYLNTSFSVGFKTGLIEKKLQHLYEYSSTELAKEICMAIRN